MFKGLGNIASLLKQAQTIGPKMEQAMERLKSERVSGSAGAGMIVVHANGLGNILSVEVDPILKEKNDLEMVCDLLPAAINQAIAKSKQLHIEAMQEATGDLPMPGNLDNLLKTFVADADQETPDAPDALPPATPTPSESNE